MTTVSLSDYGNVLQSATTEVVTTMMGMEPQSCEISEVSRVIDREVVGVLGFTGSRVGTFTVSCSRQLANKMCASMLMMEPEELTDEADVADGFGEIVNMVGGNFKNDWVGNGHRMDLSIPSVNFGAAVAIPREADRQHECIGFTMTLDDGIISVDVRFIGPS